MDIHEIYGYPWIPEYPWIPWMSMEFMGIMDCMDIDGILGHLNKKQMRGKMIPGGYFHSSVPCNPIIIIYGPGRGGL